MNELRERGEQGPGPVTVDLLRHFRIIAVFNTAAVLTLFSWAMLLSYQAGTRTKQLDVDTERIEYLDVNGSQGTRAHLDSIDKSLNRIDDTLMRMLDKRLENK